MGKRLLYEVGVYGSAPHRMGSDWLFLLLGFILSLQVVIGATWTYATTITEAYSREYFEAKYAPTAKEVSQHLQAYLSQIRAHYDVPIDTQRQLERYIKGFDDLGAVYPEDTELLDILKEVTVRTLPNWAENYELSKWYVFGTPTTIRAGFVSLLLWFVVVRLAWWRFTRGWRWQQQAEGDDLQLGEILAVRTCDITPDGYLYSKYGENQRLWVPGEPLLATCQWGCKETPSVDCHSPSGFGCGIYAYKPGSKKAHQSWLEVGLYGVVLEHKDGYRAQCAIPLRVNRLLFKGTPEQLDMLTQRYSLEVVNTWVK